MADYENLASDVSEKLHYLWTTEIFEHRVLAALMGQSLEALAIESSRGRYT